MPYGEKADNDLRHAIEFILRYKPYTESDIMKKDYLTFLRILKEAEIKAQAEIDRLEANK